MLKMSLFLKLRRDDLWSCCRSKVLKKSQKMKVKEKSHVRTTRVIKKQTFRSHCQMNNLSCHHISKKSTRLMHRKPTPFNFSKDISY